MFLALDEMVRKSCRGMKNGMFDKEKLVRDVMACAAAYPRAKLEAMWAYKSYVKQAVKVDGGKNYPRHRPK